MLREKNGIARELERSQTVESNKKFTKALVDCSKKKEDVKAEISENGVILNFRQDPKKNGHVMPWGGKFSDPGFRESLIDRLMQVGLEHLLPKIDSILDVKK
jgi:hypothetical protein